MEHVITKTVDSILVAKLTVTKITDKITTEVAIEEITEETTEVVTEEMTEMKMKNDFNHIYDLF